MHRKFLTFLVILVLLASELSVLQFGVFPVYASTTEEVYTNSFDARVVDWFEFGSSPYLQDSTSDYIYIGTDLKEEGDWHFPASAGSGTINSVKIRFELKETIEDAGAMDVYVWNGASWVFADELCCGTTYLWYEIDVSAILTTWAKINGAEVYVHYVKVATSTWYARRLTRKVSYTPPDTTKPTYSNVGTNTTAIGQPCNFSVTLADETALANYTFGTNNTGLWVNGSAVTISGISYKANTTKTLNSTVGIVIQWEYWFADSSNNKNNTGIQSLTTTSGRAWHDVSTWTASMGTRTWSSGTSWTANLNARTWSSGTSWLFDFGTRIWVDVSGVAGTTHTSTFYITSGENDGWVLGNIFNGYQYAHDNGMTSGVIGNVTDSGQIYDVSLDYYYIWRSFLKFDTSVIPSGATITNASLGLYGWNDDSTTDFIINLQKWTGDTPITTADYNQFDGINYDDGNFNTTNFITTGDNNITITNLDLITKSGNTLVCVRSSRDVSETPPTGSELVAYYTYEKGSGYVPQLTVTWETAGQGFTFDLVTRAWENITWIFYFGASTWNDVAAWVFYPLTRLWSDIAVWAFDATAMMWRDLSWLFYLLPPLPEWVNVAFWMFSLRSPEWMLAALWNLQLGGAGIAFLFIAILLLIVIVVGIIAIAYRRQK